MTTIVTRLYPDAKTADKAVAALHELGLPKTAISVVGAGGDAEAELKGAQVPEDSAAAYAANLEGDRKVVVARAPFAPIGIALKSIKAMNGFASIDAGVANENVHIAIKPDRKLYLSADTGHSRLFTKAEPGYSSRIGLISQRFGFNMLRNRVFTGKSIIERTSDSAIKGGRLFTGTTESLNRPGLVAGGEVRSGSMAGGSTMSGTVFSNMLNWKTISDRREA